MCNQNRSQEPFNATTRTTLSLINDILRRILKNTCTDHSLASLAHRANGAQRIFNHEYTLLVSSLYFKPCLYSITLMFSKTNNYWEFSLEFFGLRRICINNGVR